MRRQQDTPYQNQLLAMNNAFLATNNAFLAMNYAKLKQNYDVLLHQWIALHQQQPQKPFSSFSPAQLVEEIDAMKKICGEQADRLEKMADENKRLKRQINALTVGRGTLQKRDDKRRTENERLWKKIGDLTEALSLKDKEIEELWEKIGYLAKALSLKDKEIEELWEKIGDSIEAPSLKDREFEQSERKSSIAFFMPIKTRKKITGGLPTSNDPRDLYGDNTGEIAGLLARPHHCNS